MPKMRTFFLILSGISARSFLSVKVGLCEDTAMAEENQLILRFEKQCSEYDEQKLVLSKGIESKKEKFGINFIKE